MESQSTNQHPFISLKYPIDYDPSLNGLRGWMIIVIIGRVLTIIMGINAIMDIRDIDVDPEFSGFMSFLIIATVLIDILLSGVILIMIFQRNIAFRMLIVIQVCLTLIFIVGIWIYAGSWGITPAYEEIVSPIVGGAIWITYLYRSRRVRNTFICLSTRSFSRSRRQHCRMTYGN